MPPGPRFSLPPLPAPRVHNKAFELALQKYLDDLGVKSELPWFQASDPQEIVALIRNQQDAYQKDSKLHQSVECWNTKIIEPLRNFFTAVDQGVSSHPEIGGIVWGCIRFIIETLSGHSRYFNKIVSVLEVISQELHSYHQYATLLYRDSDVVQTALADVYGAILGVCQVVHRCFYGPGQLPRSSACIFIRSLSPWITSKLDTVIQKFKATTTNLEKEIHLERQVREHKQYESAEQKHKREKIAKLELTKRKLLEKIPHIEYQDKHESCTAIFSGRRDPRGQWLLHTKPYQLWRTCQFRIDDPASHLLWVRGKFGIGKTVLASIVVNDLKSMANVKTNIAVAYFYCERDQTSKIDPLNILGTILYQLISLLPPDSLAMQTLNDKCVLPVTVSDLKELLTIVLRGLARTYIVIDALDECPDTALQQLPRILVSLSRKASILVTTGLHAPRIQWFFKRDAQPIVVTADHVNPDIEQYIRQCIVAADNEADQNRDFGPVIEVRDLSLRNEIAQILIKNAEGIFLWVRLQVQHLAEQRTDHDIRMSLQELSRSLDATYIRSLERIHHLDDKRRKRVQGVFRWLICAGSPGLNVELVRHAIALDEMSDHWDSSMVVTNRDGLISDCANLVEFTATPHSKDKDSKPVSTIQFIHTSVKDFLVNPSNGNSNELQSARHMSRNFLFRSLSSAHHKIFQSCFKSLSLLNRRTEEPDPCPELSDYVRGPSLLLHLCNADHKDNPELESLTQSFLAMLSMTTSPIQGMLRDNDEVDIGHHVAVHIAANLSCSNIMGHLLTHNGLSVVERDKFGRTPLHYAAGCLPRCSPVADNGYDCIRLLLKAKADVNAVDKRGCTALHYIAEQEAGCRSIPDHFHPELPIKLLLRKGADPNIPDVQGDTALHCASRCDWVDKETVQILVEHGNPSISNKNGETCLHVLMNNEMPDNDVLKTLLDAGASSDAQDAHDKTPLHILVGKSQFYKNLVQTVEVLLSCRAGLNVNARDKEGMTPLHILARDKGPLCNHKRFPEAAGVGHDILRLLLKHGADVRAQDLNGSTPYQLIVMNDRIAPRTKNLVRQKPLTVSMSKKAPIRLHDSLPVPWKEEEQDEYSRNRIMSAPIEFPLGFRRSAVPNGWLRDKPSARASLQAYPNFTETVGINLVQVE